MYMVLQSIATAFHALSMTTLLLRRWLLYYGLLPSLVRLVALQAISGALLQINLHKLVGPQQPIAAWVIASVTTSMFDVLVRWITSNIVDCSDPRTTTPQRGFAARSSQAVSLVVGAGRSSRSRVEDRYALQAMDVASRSRVRAEAALRLAGAGAIRHHNAEEGEVLPLSPTSAATNPRTTAVKTYTQSLTITGRRVFHWDVAVRRNLCSLALLSFVTMWVLLIDSMYPIPLDSPAPATVLGSTTATTTTSTATTTTTTTGM